MNTCGDIWLMSLLALAPGIGFNWFTAPGPVAGIYVCGITPYDATHMGHAATYVAFDLVQRVWLDNGHDVHYVQNVTDIDDPLLERAVRDGQDWEELADRETALFRGDMTALAVVPPRDYVGAVESIPDVVAAVRALGFGSCAAWGVRSVRWRAA